MQYRNSPDDSGLKEEFLPGPTEVLRPVDHGHPVLPVQRHLDEVGVRPERRESTALEVRRSVCPLALG